MMKYDDYLTITSWTHYDIQATGGHSNKSSIRSSITGHVIETKQFIGLDRRFGSQE